MSGGFMEYKDITLETNGDIAVLSLNSPKTINALSRNVISEVTSALTSIGNGDAKVLVLKANGKHYCSGHNLTEMVDGSLLDYKAIFENCSAMMQLIHRIPQIVIAQIHGVATAAGCQLAATCDLAVADETARFGTPGVKIGLFCTTPMVALSRAVGRKLALEMLLTGRLISAQEALLHGLINKVVPEADLEAATMEMANNVAKASPLVLKIGKKAFYDQIELDEPRAYNYANNVISLNIMAEDAQEGIKAFLGKKEVVWKGR
jgi:enoyl-CoA hydratase/carnithine racemase